MANSDKNIVITPNISQTAQPNIVFKGQGNIPVTLKVLDDSYGTLSFEGSAGQLFSINNNLTSGVIFAVNDVSGIPQIDVNADGTIRLAPFAASVQVAGHTLGRGTGSVSSNVVFGVSAFAACTTGSANTSIGQISLANLTTGSNNTGIGSWGLGYITTTSGNTSLGAEAGRLNVSGTSLTGVTNSIYIGYQSIGNNSASNEIAIGTSAAGKGSNTTVLGNTSTTTAYIYGETHYIGGVAGTAVSIKPQTRSTGAGANITVGAADGVTSGAGGTLYLTGGFGPTGNGGDVFLKGGDTGSGTRDGTIISKVGGNGNYNCHEFRYGVAATYAFFDQLGRFCVTPGTSTTTIPVDSTIYAATRAATSKGLIVKGFTSQSANLTEWQNSAGTVLSVFDASGSLAVGTSTITDTLNVYNATYPYIRITSSGATSGMRIGIESTSFAQVSVYQANMPLTFSTSGTSSGLYNERMRVAHDGLIGINSASPGAQLQVTASTAATKGLIVKGFTSQSGNLQEWQNSAGTALASVNSGGGISATAFSAGSFSVGTSSYVSGTFTTVKWLGTEGQYVNIRKLYGNRTIPTTVGNYVELGRMSRYGSAPVTITIHANSASGQTGMASKIYMFCTEGYYYGGGTVPPISSYVLAGGSGNFDFELEAAIDPTDANYLTYRVRRTVGTAQADCMFSIEVHNFNSSALLEASNTGTSSLGLSYLNTNNRFTTVTPPPPAGGTGAGVNLNLVAGSGVSSGAGGSIILQPGAQATTGGNGSVRIVDGSSSSNYLSMAASSTEFSVALTGVSNNVTTGGINFNGINIRGLGTVTTGALSVGYFYCAGSTLRAVSGLSVQLGSSNGTSTDNINYIWMRQDGHIAWYGDIGLRRDNVGTLTVTNASTGGGSFAFTSSSPTAYAADQNDLVLTGSAFQRLSGSAARNITGVAPPTGGSHVDGRMMRIYNVGSTNNLTLKHNSTSSAAANRFFCVQAADIILAPNDFAELIYDGTNNGSGAAGWRVA